MFSRFDVSKLSQSAGFSVAQTAKHDFAGDLCDDSWDMESELDLEYQLHDLHLDAHDVHSALESESVPSESDDDLLDYGSPSSSYASSSFLRSHAQAQTQKSNVPVVPTFSSKPKSRKAFPVAQPNLPFSDRLAQSSHTSDDSLERGFKPSSPPTRPAHKDPSATSVPHSHSLSQFQPLIQHPAYPHPYADRSAPSRDESDERRGRGRSKFPKLLWASNVDKQSLAVLSEYHRRRMGCEMAQYDPTLKRGVSLAEWVERLDACGL